METNCREAREIELSAEIVNYYAINAEEFLSIKKLELEGQEGPTSNTHRSSAYWGICHENFPFYQVVRSIAPNIMAGNTKHWSPCQYRASGAQRRIANLLQKEAVLPEGFYKIC